jgi:hypothetical protein
MEESVADETAPDAMEESVPATVFNAPKMEAPLDANAQVSRETPEPDSAVGGRRKYRKHANNKSRKHKHTKSKKSKKNNSRNNNSRNNNSRKNKKNKSKRNNRNTRKH